MGWRILQAAVALAVLFANIYWQWTPNGVLAGLWAGMAAIAVTWTVGKAVDIRRFGWAALPNKKVLISTTTISTISVVGIIGAVIMLALGMMQLAHACATGLAVPFDCFGLLPR